MIRFYQHRKFAALSLALFLSASISGCSKNKGEKGGGADSQDRVTSLQTFAEPESSTFSTADTESPFDQDSTLVAKQEETIKMQYGSHGRLRAISGRSFCPGMKDLPVMYASYDAQGRIVKKTYVAHEYNNLTGECESKTVGQKEISYHTDYENYGRLSNISFYHRLGELPQNNISMTYSDYDYLGNIGSIQMETGGAAYTKLFYYDDYSSELTGYCFEPGQVQNTGNAPTDDCTVIPTTYDYDILGNRFSVTGPEDYAEPVWAEGTGPGAPMGGIVDFSSDDIDGDGCPNEDDPDPTSALYTCSGLQDTDGDGIHDGLDGDDDGDGCPDSKDPDPLDPAQFCVIDNPRTPVISDGDGNTIDGKTGVSPTP